MAQAEQLLNQSGIPFAALGMGEIEELPNREITRMRCHKEEKSGFDICVTEGSELVDFVFWDAHKTQRIKIAALKS